MHPLKTRLFYSLLFILSFHLSQLSAQEDKAKEIGLNVSGVVSSIFNGNPILSDPHTIVFKWQKAGSKYLRIGAGLSISSVNSSSGFLSNNVYEFYLKFGIENRKEIFKNFYWMYGIDLLTEGNIERLHTRFGNSAIASIEKDGWGLGVAPFLGFIFEPHPKIRITTESPLNIIFRKLYSKTEQTIPDINETSVDNMLRVNHQLPGVIYLYIKL